MFNNTQANREGWGLFTVEGGRLEIQRMDAGPLEEDWDEDGNGEPIFASDAEARAFVGLKGLMGSDYHFKALELENEGVGSCIRAALELSGRA